MKHFFLFLMICCPLIATAQQTFVVNGDADKYYPVTFYDGGWYLNKATEVEIGRSHVHQDSDNRGSLIAKFRFHTTNWGHGSNFVDADIRQYNYGNVNQHFIAGFADASGANAHLCLVVWLKGGGTTYVSNSNVAVTVQVYDASPFVTTNGISYTYKTELDAYIVSAGISLGGDLTVRGSNTVAMGTLSVGTQAKSSDINLPNVTEAERAVGLSWYHSTANPTEYGIHKTAGPWVYPAYQQLRLGWNTGIILDPGKVYEKSYVDIVGSGLRVTTGNVGIGTTSPGSYKLAVEGTIGARKVKVTSVASWADHVFTDAHQRPSLLELDAYIQAHKHLPGIPAESTVKREGIDLAEMNVKLLEKVEELTLYVIELKKELDALKNSSK